MAGLPLFPHGKLKQALDEKVLQPGSWIQGMPYKRRLERRHFHQESSKRHVD
jgi:hypothetical protein